MDVRDTPLGPGGWLRMAKTTLSNNVLGEDGFFLVLVDIVVVSDECYNYMVSSGLGITFDTCNYLCFASGKK